MMTKDVVVGTKTFTIIVNKQVDAIASGPFPSVATAVADGAVVLENGSPVERSRGSDEDAMADMVAYLEQHFASS